ncbi:hypothetical protein DIS24_g5358 [Lasiodiplodia hormozganensis]|uniref:Uncharacterized protein n=1 Tax=Lasiodiplodia hormozganensis TaxID=869390 RepID=A0AA39YKJ3_9PEZI|nr:hypothetical protein DIS24_g5358 [Lasiodiplodia hormozganensis]
MAPDYSRTDIKIIRASNGVVETETALALCVQKRLQVHPEHINWWHMDLEQTNLTVQEDFIQRQSLPSVGQLWRYDTYERMAHSAHLQAAILEMTDPDQGRPDPPAQPDPLPKLEQIDSASAETIVIKKERDSSPLKDDPDPGFIDDPKVTVDAGTSWLKVEKSEDDSDS